MKSLSTVLSLLVCIAPPVLAAEEWLSIQTISPNITFALDKGSLERHADRVKFWEKIVYAQPEIMDDASGSMIKEKKAHRIMDCVEKTQGLVYGITYGENGRFITSISLDEDRLTLSAIPPETIAAAEFALVCAEAPGETH